MRMLLLGLIWGHFSCLNVTAAYVDSMLHRDAFKKKLVASYYVLKPDMLEKLRNNTFCRT